MPEKAEHCIRSGSGKDKRNCESFTSGITMRGWRLKHGKRGNKMISKPFQSIVEACQTTGLSQKYLRSGCKAGTIPHIRSGSKYLVNIPKLLRQLGAEEGEEKHE